MTYFPFTSSLNELSLIDGGLQPVVLTVAVLVIVWLAWVSGRQLWRAISGEIRKP